MTISTKKINGNFKFRTKFETLLNFDNHSSIVRAFNQFCSFDSEDALETLWGMTYSKENAQQELYILGLNSDIIPSEKVLLLRNELRYQYEEVTQKGFVHFYESTDEKITNAFKILTNRADSIVASKVYKQCDVLFEKSEVDRVLFLLKSDKEAYYFGGIRSLGFDMEESEYLKPYHLEIHNLLEAMNNSLPFDIEEEIDENEEEKTETEERKEETENIQNDQQFKKISPEEILKNIVFMEVFKIFYETNDLNMLITIAQLGFDLNEVMSKKEEIFKFINAVEDLIK